MITCWRCRRIVSAHIDAGVPLPDWTRQHMERCPPCREFYESGMAMAQRLSATAGGERREPSAFLQGKIMSAVRSDGNAGRKPAAARLGWAMAVSVACVVVAGTVWLRRPPTPHQIASKPVPVPTQQVLNASVPAPTRVNQWLETSEAPLENETQLVLNDAKTAVNTLAKSLLPDDLIGSSAKNRAP